MSMQVMRGWATRHASWMGLIGLLGATQEVQAGDYDGSPQVAEFVGEMTRDYGFAGEQLMGVFREAERKQSILDAISKPAERVKQWKLPRRGMPGNTRIKMAYTLSVKK